MLDLLWSSSVLVRPSSTSSTPLLLLLPALGSRLQDQAALPGICRSHRSICISGPDEEPADQPVGATSARLEVLGVRGGGAPVGRGWGGHPQLDSDRRRRNSADPLTGRTPPTAAPAGFFFGLIPLFLLLFLNQVIEVIRSTTSELLCLVLKGFFFFFLLCPTLISFNDVFTFSVLD